MISKALERIIWRFKQGKSFLPNETDVRALNEIVEYVNDSREKYASENVGFAKLYIWAYAEMVKKYNGTIYDDIPQKELHRQLNMPLDYFHRKFTEFLNEKEIDEFFKELGIPRIHPALDKRTAEDKKRDIKKLQDALELKDNRLRFEGRVWEEETVKDNLMAMVADAVIKYKL